MAILQRKPPLFFQASSGIYSDWKILSVVLSLREICLNLMTSAMRPARGSHATIPKREQCGFLAKQASHLRYYNDATLKKMYASLRRRRQWDEVNTVPSTNSKSPKAQARR